MKINLIKVDSVHSKENAGILPRVSLSLQPVLWVKGTKFGVGCPSWSSDYVT